VADEPRAKVFTADSIPFDDVPWCRTKVLIGRGVSESSRENGAFMVKITENAAGTGGAHSMHQHPDQDEVLYVLEGHGENVSSDNVIQPFGPGDVIYVPAGVMHEDRSTGGTVTFLVVKAPPD
jgi:mannose-6-phosphate isomerase-like protein (cupin superfamily)